MNVYLLKIMTPEKQIYESKVISVTVTGTDGRLTVLAGHEIMAATVTEGPIIIRTEQETMEGVTGRGMMWVNRNEVAVMVHGFKWADEEADIVSAEDAFAGDMMI